MRALSLCLWLCLSVAVSASSWNLPEFEAVRLPRPLPGPMTYKQALNGRTTLVVGDDFVQLNEGNRGRWRVRLLSKVELPIRGPALRYETHTSELVVLRAFVRNTERTQFGDVAVALRLQDGRVAWVSDPLPATADRVGAPNVRQGDVVYETYVSPSWRAVIVARRLRDGVPIFMRDVPEENGVASDQIGRTVQRLQPRADGVMVYVADRQRRWNTYLFGRRDGVLKQTRSGHARAGDRLWE